MREAAAVTIHESEVARVSADVKSLGVCAHCSFKIDRC